MTEFQENNISNISSHLYYFILYTKKKKISISIDYLKSAIKNIIIKIHS